MSEPAAHPHGPGRPLSESEQARFAALVADLAGDRARVSPAAPARPHVPRRGAALSGWPAWLTAAVGVLLVLWGGLQDQGGPLLLGVVLTGTSSQWLRLPALAELRTRWV
ncbi:MAG: hypothetical protein JWN35_5 [Frankiales bacterium]|nr:hypothetical protein [Frankiales bacterium]